MKNKKEDSQCRENSPKRLSIDKMVELYHGKYKVENDKAVLSGLATIRAGSGGPLPLPLAPWEKNRK